MGDLSHIQTGTESLHELIDVSAHRMRMANAILYCRNTELYPADNSPSDTLSRFGQAIRTDQKLATFFDGARFKVLRASIKDAKVAYLSVGDGVLMVTQIPDYALPDNGFQIFSQMKPTETDVTETVVGYNIYHASRKERTVDFGFDIIPSQRQNPALQSSRVFTAAAGVLSNAFTPEFLTVASSQINETAIGDPATNAAFYLKRGFYPPGNKSVADELLTRMLQGERIDEELLRTFARQSSPEHWQLPLRNHPA